MNYYCFTDAGSEVIGGDHEGPVVTPWYSTDAGYLQVLFYAPGTSYCPDGGGGLNTGCSGWDYQGAMTEASDYREYQVGATPLLLPLRFPGQYYDQETDFVENWNRFYDPSVGRYLEVEPLLTTSGDGISNYIHGKLFGFNSTQAFGKINAVAVAAQAGGTLPAYAYAQDNPLHFTDPDGLKTYKDSCDNPEWPIGAEIEMIGSARLAKKMTVVLTGLMLMASAIALGLPADVGIFRNLKLRGSGCHRELLFEDGGRACWGVVEKTSSCKTVTSLVERADGGMRAEKYALGSACAPPGPRFVTEGLGLFFVDQLDGGAFRVICDDAPPCQRGSRAASIQRCCAEDAALRGTAACNVEPTAGLCEQPSP